MDKGKRGVQMVDILKNPVSELCLKDVFPSLVRSAFGQDSMAGEFQVMDFFVASLEFSQLPMNFPDQLATEGGFRTKGIFAADSISYLGNIIKGKFILFFMKCFRVYWFPTTRLGGIYLGGYGN